MTTAYGRLRAEHPEDYCPGCGHLWRMHQASTADQGTALDDPVPCFAVRFADDRRVTEVGEMSGFCECRALLLDPELAREVRRRQST